MFGVSCTHRNYLHRVISTKSRSLPFLYYDLKPVGFQARSQNYEKLLLGSSCLSLRWSVNPHGTMFPLPHF